MAKEMVKYFKKALVYFISQMVQKLRAIGWIIKKKTTKYFIMIWDNMLKLFSKMIKYLVNK